MLRFILMLSIAFYVIIFPSCTIDRTSRIEDSDTSSLSSSKKCSIDIECGAGYKCSHGVCTGGIVPEIKGECVVGDFGKKVCSNTGKECNVDSECFK